MNGEGGVGVGGRSSGVESGEISRVEVAIGRIMVSFVTEV